MTDLLRLFGRCELEASAADKPRRLSIVGYTGGLMTVDSFGAVVVDLLGMQIPATIPVLSDHTNTLASIIASGSPVVSNGMLAIKATLADSDAARSVVSLLSSGVALQASIGASPTQRRFVKAGENVLVNGRTIKAADGGFQLIEKSTLREISVTPIGADANTSVSLAAKLSGAIPVNENEIIVVERERIKKIDTVCRGFEADTRIQAARSEAIEGALSFEGLQATCLETIRASRPSAPFSFGGSASVNQEHLVEAALMIRAGREKLAVTSYGEAAVEAARRLRDKTMVGLESLVARATNDGVIKASSFSLPVALGNVSGKILVESYRENPQTWRTFARVLSARDFKDQVAVRPSALDNLEEVGSNGEIKHSSITESTYSWSIGQFAKMLTIDRKSIVNDDLGFFDSLIPSMATAAARSLSDLVWSVIHANAGSFFASGNTNLVTSVSALSAANLGAALARMRKQRDSKGNDLDIQPSVLVVGPELEMTARAILESTEVMQSAGLPNGNALKGAVQLVVEPRVSNIVKYTSAVVTNWFVFAAPMAMPVVVGFLHGQEFPQIETIDVGPNHLGTGLRCVFDYGAALGDFRAAQKATGAA